NALSSLAATAGGIPFGPTTARHIVKTTSTPSSLSVGVWGSSRMREGPVTASGRSLPAVTWGMSWAVDENVAAALPPTTAPGGVATEDGQRRRAPTVERDVVVLHARGLGRHPHGKVSGAPRPRVREVELSGILLHVVECLAHRLPGCLVPHGEDRGTVVDARDRRELIGTDGRLLHEREDRVGPGTAEHDRVAVRLGADHVLRADGAAASGLEHDEQWLAQVLLGDAGDGARGEVVRASRSVRQHQLDRLRGKVLGRGRPRAGQTRDDGDTNEDGSDCVQWHAVPPGGRTLERATTGLQGQRPVKSRR